MGSLGWRGSATWAALRDLAWSHGPARPRL